MNKQNTKTETEATRNETLKKWTLETLCNIAILISGHPEIEDDVLNKICEDVESVELAIHTYLKSPHPEPKAPLYKIEVIDINRNEVAVPPVSKPICFTHKEGCIVIVRPISEDELDEPLK